MGTLHHNSMMTHMVVKELRQALVTMIAPETTKKGITSIDILVFIFITRISLTMNINHGIRKHVVFLDYIAMSLLSVGKEWKHKRG